MRGEADEPDDGEEGGHEDDDRAQRDPHEDPRRHPSHSRAAAIASVSMMIRASRCPRRAKTRKAP